MKVRISEIFYSIQGEGVYAGVPTTFIRFQGCNLLTGCSWCDTAYARKGDNGKLMEVEDILDEIVRLEPRTYRHLVCITGGEPLFQEEALHELVKRLIRYGFLVEVETNGTIPKPTWWTLVNSWVADIKCPSSGVTSLVEEWFEVRVTDQLKFVIKDEVDVEYTKEVVSRHPSRNMVILVSPVLLGDDVRSSDNLARMRMAVELCKELKARFSLQIHKVVWGNKRGV